jgi:flagellar biogenesis protein FliO
VTPLGRYVVETIVTLLFVAGLAIVVLLVARRGGMGRALGPLSLAGRLVLDARRAIYLVRVGDTLYVVGASEAGLTKLGELAGDALDAGGSDTSTPLAASVPSFKDLLARIGATRAEPRAETPPARATSDSQAGEP